MGKKYLAVLAATAALTVGMSISTYAAAGWAQSGSTWVYYDNNGSKVTNAWKKGADDKYRYLNGRGEMTVNSWVDDQYYVDANGIMIADQWIQLGANSSGSTEGTGWYYFTGNGKVTATSWKKINNKWYYFGDDGQMQVGWILDNMYYTLEDGTMLTGWQNLYPPADQDNNDTNIPYLQNSDLMNWYYFSTSGKKFVPEDLSGDYGERKVNGTYYCFDENGAMQTGWRNIGDDKNDITSYKFFMEDGKARTGWLSAEPPEDLQSNYDDDVEWFYFMSTGKPKAGREGDAYMASDITKINGISYLFNSLGNPVYGLQKVYLSGTTGTYTSYYFGDKATSSVLKGKQKVEEGDGTVSEFYFLESGKGFSGVKDSHLYYMGKLQKMGEGKYTVVTVDRHNYVVNSGGKIVKNSTVKNSDGVKYKTNSSGILTHIDGEAVSSSETFEDPIEPNFSEN